MLGASAAVLLGACSRKFDTAPAWADSATLDGGQTTATIHNFTVQVPSGSNRAALVALGLDAVSATSVVLDPAGANIALTRVRDWQKPPSGASLWRLLETEMPASGSYTLRVTLSAASEVLGHWQSAVNVAQEVFAVGNWEASKTAIALRADRVYASGSLAYAAMLESSQRSGWTVSQLFKKLELQDVAGGDTFVVARGRLTADGAPEPAFSNASSAVRLVGFQAFLQPVGEAGPTLRTINRPATGDWTDHGTQISRAAGTWEDGIATSSGCNGLCVVEWKQKLYCLYLGYDGDRSDGGARHRALGYATSDDGVTWTKHGGNPVITHQGSGTNNEEEGVWGFAAAINPNNDELNVAWGALQAVSASTVRSDLSLTVTSDGASWSNNAYATNLIIINASAGVFLGTSGNDELYGFALGWNTTANRWELWYMTKVPEDWHVYHVHGTNLASLSNANDSDWFSQSAGTSSREWRIGTFVDRRNGNRDLMFNRYQSSGTFEIAYRPVNSPPTAGSLATLYDFDALDGTTKRGYCGITPAAGLGKWVLPYWLTAEGTNDRTEGIRFKTATISYATAATGSPADDGGGGPALLSVPSFGAWLTSDQSNLTPTKYVSNQNRGNGSGSTPGNAQELQAALNGASAGQRFQAVCQTPGVVEYWNYPNGLTFPSGSSGNHIVLEARQGDGIVLSRAEDFAGARTPGSGYWTQSGLSADDISKKIWRSVGTVAGGAQTLFGFWMEFGHPHQLLPAGSMTNLRAAYGTSNSPTNYSGPMVHKDSDNRVYIRMQRPHVGKYSVGSKWSNHIWPGHPEAISGGQLVYPLSEDPNDYPIHIFRPTTVNCINGGDWVELGNGINSLGYYFMSNRSNLIFRRGIDLTWRGWALSGTTQNWFADRRRMSDGSKLHVSRAEWKFGGWLESGFRSGFILTGGGGELVIDGLYCRDCTIADYHELGASNSNGRGHWRWRNCVIWHIVDDGLQVIPATTRVEFGYCFFLGAAYGGPDGGSNPDPNPGEWFFHHNIIDVREEHCSDWRGQPHPHFPYMPHSPNRDQPHRNYNNTLLVGADLEQQIAFGFGHMTTGDGANRNDEAVAHEVFNNIIIRQVWDSKRYDPLTYSFAPNNNPSDFVMGQDMQYNPNDSNEFWDYNLYYRDLDGTTAVDVFCEGVCEGGVKTHNYASLAAWKASAQFTASKASGTKRGAYSPGFEANASDLKPTMPSIDDFPTSRFDYRPEPESQVTVATSASLSGVNWWSTPPSWGATYFDWSGLAPSPWKGALDPNGSTLPVGVENP